MNREHVTEEVLQEIAGVPDLAGFGEDIRQHIATCPTCREKVEAYQAIYAMIAMQPQPTLGTDLASAIMEQLAPKRPSSKLTMVYCLTAMGIVMGGIAIIKLSPFNTNQQWVLAALLVLGFLTVVQVKELMKT